MQAFQRRRLCQHMPKHPAVQLPFLISSCLIPRVCETNMLAVGASNPGLGLCLQDHVKAEPVPAVLRLAQQVPPMVNK